MVIAPLFNPLPPLKYVPKAHTSLCDWKRASKISLYFTRLQCWPGWHAFFIID
jgi:hypothetical protein